MGRKSTFSKKVGDEICLRIAQGESLRAICKSKDMPDISTVLRWALSDSDLYKGFREQYARARQIWLEVIEDEILDIADDGSNDWMTRTRRDGTEEEVFNQEHYQRSRLRVEARERLIARIRGGGSNKGKRSVGPDGKALAEKPQTVILEILPKPMEPKK